MGTPVTHIEEEDREALHRLSDMELYSNQGKHAAGLVITTNRTELRAQVPMAWIASSKTMVSQYDGPTIEALGLVKLDVLGVKNLSVLRQCLINMGRNPKDGLDWIPLRDPKVMAMISKGLTAGVFQLEGKTSAREVKRLKPTTIKDVIAAMALFRPGVMRSGGMTDYIERKHRQEEVPQRHEVLAKATADTYGVMLYQDSVIEVLRNIGLSQEELNAMLKAVKASNKNVAQAKTTMEKHRAEVYRLCEEVGMKEEEIDWLWKAIEGFSDYSFNRSHATIYGITAWRCAYLSFHHPLEFHAALLAVASGSDKERDYQIATRARQIHLLKPDVCNSGATYTVDPKGRGIRRGLTSIKGVGVATAREIERKQPFNDLKDFCDRVKISGIKDWAVDGTYEVGALQTLAEAGALKPLGVTIDG
jgi:DNA polymerase-3 subunit alpha